MKEYTFWYTEEITYKAGFKAENAIEASMLLSKVQRGEVYIEELPEFWNKHKDGGVTVTLETIQEEQA